MNVHIPGDFDLAVKALISEGRYRDEGEVVAEGIKLLLIKEQLRTDVQAGIADLDAGNRVDAKEVHAEARRRVGEIEEGRTE